MKQIFVYISLVLLGTSTTASAAFKGGFFDHEVTSFTEQDQEEINKAWLKLVDENQLDKKFEWRNDDTGRFGTITETENFKHSKGYDCKRLIYVFRHKDYDNPYTYNAVKCYVPERDKWLFN